MKTRIFLIQLISLVLILYSCENAAKHTESDESKIDQINPEDTFKKLDIGLIREAIGKDGSEHNGEFKVTVPQNDLDVTVDGFKIIPPMGLGSWVAFAPAGNQAMIMGDIIVTEKDLKPVQQEVIRQGLMITAIHNHFIRNHPNIMYMHIGGMGNEAALATKVKAIFDKVDRSRGGDPSEGPETAVLNTLDTAMIARTIGYHGQINRGVYKITIGRPDVNLNDHGAPVSTFLGFNTWASWQGTQDKAAVAGDFTMLADEVSPVIQALVKNDIEVVALHNHMIHEDPRIFFLHYWGVGSAEKLAEGLREAIDQTGVNK